MLQNSSYREQETRNREQGTRNREQVIPFIKKNAISNWVGKCGECGELGEKSK